MDDQLWRTRAKCIGMPKDFFFPEGDERYRKMRRAKRFCRGQEDGRPCPVLEDCAEYAIGKEPFGVWGGLSETERIRVRERRRQRSVL